MTVQDIKQQIVILQEKTKELMIANPQLEELNWRISDVPYAVFDEFRRGLNEGLTDKEEHKYMEQHIVAGKPYCVPVRGYGKGANIYVWSVPVKFKHTYEVIEEIEQPAQ